MNTQPRVETIVQLCIALMDLCPVILKSVASNRLGMDRSIRRICKKLTYSCFICVDLDAKPCGMNFMNSTCMSTVQHIPFVAHVNGLLNLQRTARAVRRTSG